MRTAKLLVILIFVSILALSVAAEQWTLPFKKDTFSAEKKRDIYFGDQFVRPVGWTGIKYATNSRQTIGGFKGSTSIDSNLPYNEWIIQGRNPQATRNYDPRVRGYPILDEFVDLIPIEAPSYDQGSVLLPRQPSGAVRIVTNRDSQKTQHSYMPRSTIYLRVGYLPELEPYEIYEAYLVDEDTGFALSIGRIIPPGIGQLNTLQFEIANDLYPYEFVMVTKENFPERQKGPQGDVVLLGEIPLIRKTEAPVSAQSYYDRYFDLIR
ncbi:hypothetical protein KY338_04250 [Candidatus Woesearchaeota archaeon]|nr:hypothetical protein [Candidatus Woesearchaeota archaeon]MBW3005807.1 hypothetical protein [Candidatus Woesearchaeota archaeon]